MSLFREYVREIHEVPEIMDTTAGDQVTAFAGQAEALDKVVEQAFVHFLVVDEANGFAFAAVLESLFYLLDEGRGNVVVEVDLGIAGYLEDPGVVGVVAEI